MTKPTSQQIASVRAALREIHAELLAWDPHVLVLFNDPPQKAQIIECMARLGWHCVDDPRNETADVSMVEFSLDPVPPAGTASTAQPFGGKVRRMRLPARFFASFGIIFALAGIVVATATIYTDYRMRILDQTGTVAAGEIERTYFTSGRGGRTYHVSYRFVDAHGISHESEDSYPFQDWRSLRPGASISVTYLANDPERNNLTQRVRLIIRRSLKEEIIWIGVPWIVAGFFFLGYWARRRPS